ncbi:MAG: cell envelope biogenesis protein TolA, partial [Candidatus Faecalibacterium intestinavium]|nr:cell envelope biogenesis protein TolA [Candidatus Faecalibacterium intestinavium]
SGTASDSGLSTTSSGYGGASPSASSVSQVRVPYSALRMQAQGKTSQQIISQLTADGYSAAEIRTIMQMLNP